MKEKEKPKFDEIWRNIVTITEDEVPSHFKTTKPKYKKGKKNGR